MISANNVSLAFGGRKLFDEVNIKFTPGNCYGLIGANGAGKSTFLKILSGDIEAQTGNIEIKPGDRLSVLKQDHFAYDEHAVLKTVLMGNQKLFAIMEEKDAIYMKEDFSDEDGIRAAELESEFAELNGWEAESEAATLLSGLGIGTEYHDKIMKDLTGSEKVKILLAQALIGDPDILLLDEPTNHLDIKAIQWLENFLMDFTNTVIVVSHDRHFLNKVCTHIADIDFGKITVYTGNYDFWRKASELAIQLRSDQRRKSEEKAAELKNFIQRFSANASKSKQATSRQKQLEKLKIEDLPISSRKYPYVHFQPTREAGKELLKVDGISKTIEGEKILDNISFTINKGDKVVVLGENDVAKTTLFQILMGEIEADSGTFEWGVTTSRAYFPNDNSSYFNDGKYSITDWLRQYSEEKDESFIRGFLGKMLFSGEEALKKTNVLSGGEKVRCMLSKMMLSGANVLLLDGPTNHLDLESITAVNEGLIKFSGTTLFTSHDHEFIQTVANRIIDIDVKLVEDKYISYDDYLNLN
ncbi:putative ABC transporter, ATP-binding protein [Halobacteriovorax marinus SJ]|uniref:Probable ATP-binding protein YbiT n=1 Tax=Halobacteriovorax marinus (strain ATCC BAA-682 / DSM 15412 / SJ) TaxID=862908 RepID=E1WXN8_HALMS|nr:ABC-F family ATP-binding cassette domain-containing protein [Halobacteriovorax marinus]CBW25844.1 putative ABC transporter, ATP-binding protein [Halobacteriovorax marinus SJ]